MPVEAAAGSLWEIRVVGSIEGQTTNNVWHFRAKAADDDVLLHLVQVLLDCFTTHLLPVLASAWSLTSVIVKQVGPTLGVETVVVPTGDSTGGNPSDALPSFTSVVFSKRTLLGGKDHRGRMYIAGIPEPATVGSRIPTDNVLWAALLAFAACVVSNFVVASRGDIGNNWEFVVYSRKLGGSHYPYTDAGVTPVNEFVPSQFLGTTRSRKVGRGS